MKKMKQQLAFLLCTILLCTAAIQTTAFADDDPKPTNIVKLNYSSRTVRSGSEFELRAYASPHDFDDDYLHWKTSNSRVVAFDDDDRTGDEMEFKARSAGTAYITCYIPGTKIQKTCKVTVTNHKSASIRKLNYTSRTVKIGSKFKLRAYASNFDDDRLRWKTSNSKIAAFEDRDRTGDDMDFIAKKAGTAYITCYIPGTKIKKTCKIKVKRYGKAKIVVDDKYVEVDQGEWEDLEARLVGGKYKKRSLSYKVSGSRYIRVKKGKVYGKRPGKAKITIRAKANKKIKKVVYVRVERDD